MAKFNPKYVSRVPKKVRAGHVLCHNHILHTVDMPPGVNGFRAWFDKDPPDHFAQCPCGWSGLPHYAWRENVKSTKGKCATWYQIARRAWDYSPKRARQLAQAIKRFGTEQGLELDEAREGSTVQ